MHSQLKKFLHWKALGIWNRLLGSFQLLVDTDWPKTEACWGMPSGTTNELDKVDAKNSRELTHSRAIKEHKEEWVLCSLQVKKWVQK